MSIPDLVTLSGSPSQPPGRRPPTVRQSADLGYVPIVVADACGAGHAEAGERALASIKFMGDAILTDCRTITDLLPRAGKA